MIEFDCNLSRQNWVQNYNRQNMNNGESGNYEDQISPQCQECNENCMGTFRGNLIIAIGLNNALKAKQKDFFEQNVKLLVKNLQRAIHHHIPNTANVFYVRPLEVPIWQDESENRSRNFDIYDKLIDEVS